jgi:hypothetical protein
VVELVVDDVLADPRLAAGAAQLDQRGRADELRRERQLAALEAERLHRGL